MVPFIKQILLRCRMLLGILCSTFESIPSYPSGAGTMGILRRLDYCVIKHATVHLSVPPIRWLSGGCGHAGGFKGRPGEPREQ